MATKTVEKPPTKLKPKTTPKTARPPLYKVILLNDDFTPREFVVKVLEAVFRMNESQAYRVMMTAHRRGACVIAVYPGRRRNQGEGGNGPRQEPGLSAVLHHRAGGIISSDDGTRGFHRCCCSIVGGDPT